MKRLALFAVTFASLLVPSSARADDDASKWAFGFVPGFRIGRAWASVQSKNGDTPSQTGWMFEVDGTGVITVPGDRISFGLAVGYVDAYLSRTDGAKNADLSYSGITLTPTIMLSLVSAVFVQGRIGWFDATWAPGNASIDKSAIRYGGGISAYVVHNHGSDLVLQLDVLRTDAGSVDLGSYMGNIGSTTVTLGAVFTFAANGLAL